MVRYSVEKKLDREEKEREREMDTRELELAACRVSSSISFISPRL